MKRCLHQLQEAFCVQAVQRTWETVSSYFTNRLWKFHHVCNFTAAGDKDELSTFWGQRSPSQLTKCTCPAEVNLSNSCTPSDIKSFVSGLSVEVLSVVEVKPRRRRGEDTDDAVDRKAFRLCINADDRERLLDASVWSDSVLISQWYTLSNKTTNAHVCLHLLPLIRQLELEIVHLLSSFMWLMLTTIRSLRIWTV